MTTATIAATASTLAAGWMDFEGIASAYGGELDLEVTFAAHDAQRTIEERLIAAPASDAAGILGKLQVFARMMDYGADSDDPAGRLLASAIRDAGRLAGEVGAGAEDPDAELKRQWANAQRPWGIEAETEEGAAEAAAQQLASLKSVATIPALTLAGLSVKVQAMSADAKDGETDFAGDLIRTALDACEQLAPGSVIYRPQTDGDNAVAGEVTTEEARP